MSKYNHYQLHDIITLLLTKGKEGDFWDFKQEWHDEMAELMKDIICFVNTTHDENCYIIFGVSDDLKVPGMKKQRWNQDSILDAISNLKFAGDNDPKIAVESITYNTELLDILIIKNTNMTQIFLTRPYGEMREGCIYTRIGDKNTSDKGNALVGDIEKLWRKRFGLLKTPLEYIYDSMLNKSEWIIEDNGFYHAFNPEYTITINIDDEERDEEFYCYAMTNERAIFKFLEIKYLQTILKSYQLIALDGGRLTIPAPTWGFIGSFNDTGYVKYSYKFYIMGSDEHAVLNFLYDEERHDHKHALDSLSEVILFYRSDDEKSSFEKYTSDNINLIEERLKNVNQFHYIDTGNLKRTNIIKERLRLGIVLNKLLLEWREMERN